MNHHRQMIHHYQNVVVQIGKWKIYDEIHGN
jgi:hypothetical protein